MTRFLVLVDSGLFLGVERLIQRQHTLHGLLGVTTNKTCIFFFGSEQWKLLIVKQEKVPISIVLKFSVLTEEKDRIHETRAADDRPQKQTQTHTEPKTWLIPLFTAFVKISVRPFVLEVCAPPLYYIEELEIAFWLMSVTFQQGEFYILKCPLWIIPSRK